LSGVLRAIAVKKGFVVLRVLCVSAVIYVTAVANGSLPIASGYGACAPNPTYSQQAVICCWGLTQENFLKIFPGVLCAFAVIEFLFYSASSASLR
jgi:hypothetical protein